ncbi:hypothetical protein [Natronococcus wangiae]|uniref:hypothetical protein n=1 Tax=Natronococcus wangiae TaxID=3068275 RepID=UPI00273EB028|nr:hypothetical protein [Natronococcus sp. AD5]
MRFASAPVGPSGPSFGPIAGLGTWLTLVLKGSLAPYGGTLHRRSPDLLVGQRPDRLAAGIEQPVLRVHSKETRRSSFLRPILDRLLFD